MPTYISILWGLMHGCIGTTLALVVSWFAGQLGFFITLNWYFLCLSVVNYDWQIRFVRLCRNSPETAMLMVQSIAQAQEKSTDGN